MTPAEIKSAPAVASYAPIARAQTILPQSPTLSLSTRQVAVSVISITDNVARIKIGNKFYDADITEHMPDSTGTMVDKKLTMTEDIAEKVQQHFQTLLGQGVFTTDTKEITLSGDNNFNFTDIKTIDSTGAETTKKITSLAPEAIVTVNTLQRYLVSQATVLRSTSAPLTSPMQAPPAVAPQAPGQLCTPPGSAAVAPSQPASTVTTPTSPVASTGTRLTEQFLGRQTNPSYDPMVHFNQLYGKTDQEFSDFSKKAGKALAKYLTEGISSDEGFIDEQLIKQELQGLAEKDRAGLHEAAKDTLNGWWPCRKEIFHPGFAEKIKAGQFDSYNPKDLVKLYANYLVKKGISDKMSEGFYEIFVQFVNDTSNTDFRRDLQIRILGKKGQNEIEEKGMYPSDQQLVPGNCIYLLQEGEKFRAYNREQSRLESLDDFTDKVTSPGTPPPQRAPRQLPPQAQQPTADIPLPRTVT